MGTSVPTHSSLAQRQSKPLPDEYTEFWEDNSHYSESFEEYEDFDDLEKEESKDSFFDNLKVF